MKYLATYDITDDSLVTSSVTEDDHAEWAAGTYALADRVIRTFTHRVYECQVAGPSTIAPEGDATMWREVQPTNRWVMLGRSVAWATSFASSIDVRVSPGAVSDIVLLGLAGTQVQVYSGATLVRTVAIPAPVSPSTTSQLVISGLGIAAGNVVGVVITGSGAVQCAHCGFGAFVDLGVTLAGAQVSMTDFSRVDTDAFAVMSITPRAYSRRLQGGASLPAALADAAIAAVESVRATVCYWSMVDDRECMGGLAFVRDFRHQEPSASRVDYSITLETLARDDLVISPGYTGAADTSLPTLPAVTGLSLAVIPGGYSITWDKPTSPAYVGTEIRNGATWDAATLSFFGAGRQHAFMWPAPGVYNHLVKHVGRGVESTTAAGVQVTVYADGTLTVGDVIWITDAGEPASWGAGVEWLASPVSYLVNTPQIQPDAATTVITTFQAGPISASSGA